MSLLRLYRHLPNLERQVAHLRSRNRQLAVENKRLQELVLQDPLTGLLNRRGFDQLFGRMFAAALRHGRNLTIAIVDIDHFKKINDERGHLAGDQALKTLGRLLASAVRTDDLVARWGGEEFVLVFNETPLKNAVVPLERLRQKVEAAEVAYLGRTIKFTISAGYTAYEPTTVPNILRREAAEVYKEQLLAKADRAMYAAKAAGKNCTRAFGR